MLFLFKRGLCNLFDDYFFLQIFLESKAHNIGFFARSYLLHTSVGVPVKNVLLQKMRFLYCAYIAVHFMSFEPSDLNYYYY